MAHLVYAPICSLDGYVEDASGSFGWARPDEEVHRFAGDLERTVGTALYGRRMWQTMRYWETADDADPVSQDFAQVWRDADKVVFSRTLNEVDTARTRLERDFDADLVRALKASADRDLSVGGADLAGQALRAGLVDVLHVIAVPVVVGGGKRALPADLRLDLELTGTRSFANGTVCLSYRVSP
ncbi:MAG: Riboflavin biosynthesis protein ribD [Frankiales bacterium]|nr:Riboflavin biosynthesis protein ribD [Frankiales bacterium]